MQVLYAKVDSGISRELCHYQVNQCCQRLYNDVQACLEFKLKLKEAFPRQQQDVPQGVMRACKAMAIVVRVPATYIPKDIIDRMISSD